LHSRICHRLLGGFSSGFTFRGWRQVAIQIDAIQIQVGLEVGFVELAGLGGKGAL
jgi:hypothetical protein